VVALTGLLMLLGLSAAFVIATVAAHRRAQAAADLAALAGAATLQSGGVGAFSVGGDACQVAARIAAGNGARLTSCRLLAGDVAVTTLLAGPKFLGQSWELSGRARAGPS
jgi:secretion/DNA translocation related TadE-like protein